MISTIIPSHTISVEPITPELRAEAHILNDPATYAIVERHGGRLMGFCNSTSNLDAAHLMARNYAHTYGAKIVEA